MRLIVAAAGIVATVWCCSALADDQPCYGMPALSVDAGVVPSLAIVKPGDRARFVKGGEQAGCPNPSAACAVSSSRPPLEKMKQPTYLTTLASCAR